MIKIELSKEQMEAVQAQVPCIGLMMASHGRFGEDAFSVAKEFAGQLGKMMAENIKRDLNITGTDANAVATALNTFLTQFVAMPAICKVDGNMVIAETEGFCPVMEAVKMLNAPWDKIDVCYSWPLFEAIALAVNPNAKMEVLEARHRGDKSCKQVFTVPK